MSKKSGKLAINHKTKNPSTGPACQASGTPKGAVSKPYLKVESLNHGRKGAKLRGNI